MQKIENNFTSIENELWAGFIDWVVIIKPEFVGNGHLLRWTITFGIGDPGPYMDPIYCDSLEKAFELVNKYKGLSYNKLIEKLSKDCDDGKLKIFHGEKR